MARPTIFERPMTAAERMRHYRARKRSGSPQPRTVRQRAAQYRVSERTVYYVKAWARASLIQWHPNGVRGFLDQHADEMRPVSVAFLAEVCRHGDARTQRKIRDCMNKAGVSAGHALWRKLRPDLAERKRQMREEAQWRREQVWLAGPA
jgi:hypothetical protein